ncbi:flagellar basal body P-ring formation protein FlgA [Paralcaligenes sp. KSB-10]|uniref:flagellar basal body P-ring formation chaperone FlgA n=1 Tax=Paralcaligenes sp. KSB-10 TaxID=2901142 RepID=UPI001E2DB64B|nr:flagellar basal body P-ring formation chaperone FlgA [Paralcaligenes sp. KSB-10]UHL65316.1 flagellar basal body P-ring formation protein FlgA [Paralcaligenes sp. KSB-10]
MFKISALFLGLATVCGGLAHAGLASGGAQDPAAIVAQAQEFLRKQALIYPGTPQITIDASRLENLPACSQLQFSLPSGGHLRSRLSVGVHCLAPEPWTSYVQASISIQGTYYVPARNLNPGEALGPENLDARQTDLLSLPPDTVIDPAQLLGRIARHRLIAGAPIKGNGLRDPQSILRGQTVRLEARGNGFVASSEGKAVQGGAPGSQIQVRTATGRIVTGTIVDGATVSVMM